MKKCSQKVNSYLNALSDEYSSSLSKVRQKNDAVAELYTLADAISMFIKKSMNKNGRCEVKPQLPSCVVSQLASGGESYVLSLWIADDERPMNLLSMTFSKYGAYPCTLRTGQDAFSCKTIVELKSCLIKICRIICFFVIEHARKMEKKNEPSCLNYTMTAGEVGLNPVVKKRKNSKCGSSSSGNTRK